MQRERTASGKDDRRILGRNGNVGLAESLVPPCGKLGAFVVQPWTEKLDDSAAMPMQRLRLPVEKAAGRFPRDLIANRVEQRRCLSGIRTSTPLKLPLRGNGGVPLPFVDEF